LEDLQLLKAFLLGIVEGLTEFLPISSTGHLIVAGELIGFQSIDGRVFEVVIQLGAILALCWVYRTRIGQLLLGSVQGNPAERRFARNILLAFLPAAATGAVLIGPIKSLLFNPLTVATALIVGGIVILLVERRQTVPRIATVDDMSWQDALKVGCVQCFALIPGTSRSGATIMGGLMFGLSRKAATEFSFYLAMPTMLGAATYDTFRNRHLLTTDDLGLLAVGFAGAFVSALIAVKALIRFISSHSFAVFAWYRIGFGLLILAFIGAGVLSGTGAG
jgi:undecaprenyl-diphosphatase